MLVQQIVKAFLYTGFGFWGVHDSQEYTDAPAKFLFVL